MFLNRLPIAFHFLLSFFCLLSCTPAPQTPQPPLQTSFYVYRFDPPAFIEFSKEFEPVGEIPFSIPPNCGLFNTFPAPVGSFIAIELNCPNGQTVLYRRSGLYMPKIGSRYLFFLNALNKHDLGILTAYELTEARVIPLDMSTQFDVFEGTSETQFLQKLRDALLNTSH